MNNAQRVSALVVVVITVLILLLSFGLTRIDTGNVGVESTLGQVKAAELPPGIHITLFKTVHEMTAKEMSMQLADMKPKTRDNLFMEDLDVDVYYRINPTKIADLTVKYQGDVKADKNGDGIVAFDRVYRTARESVYSVTSRYDALTLNTSRTPFAAELIRSLQTELNKNDPDTFTVTDINIRSLVTDKQIEQSNQANAVVLNQIKQEERQVELEKVKSERKRVAAEGEARANKIISESLDARLLELKRIDAQTAFATQGTHTVLMQGGATPLIQVK